MREYDFTRREIKVKNLENKNTIFRHTDWIYGMILLAGDECLRLEINTQKYKQIQNTGIYTSVILFSLVAQIIMALIQSLIYAYYYQDDYYILKGIAKSVIILPYGMILVRQVVNLLLTIISNHKFNSQQKSQSIGQALIKSIEDHPPLSPINQNNDHVIIDSDDKKVLLSFHQHQQIPQVDLSNKSNNTDKFFKKNGIQYQALNKFYNIQNINMILFENPQVFLKHQRVEVTSLLMKEKQYQFTNNMIPHYIKCLEEELKHNYAKTLIDKKLDYSIVEDKQNQYIDELFNEKKISTLHSKSNDEPLNKQSIKEFKVIKLSSQQNSLDPMNPQQRQLFSFRKNSSKNINNHSNQLSGSEMQQKKKMVAPQLKQTKSFRITNPREQKSVSYSNLKEPVAASQTFSTEVLTDKDFVDNLVSCPLHNEVLIMLLLCTTQKTLYDMKNKQVKQIFYGEYEKNIVEFVGQFEYFCQCSSYVENTRSEYCVKYLNKRVIKIQQKMKVFEVLSLNYSKYATQSRLSVLVRDPDSFLLEEGTILYTRIETSEQKDNEELQEIRLDKLNELLFNLLWSGQKTYIYTKKVLSQQETEKFLENINFLNESYGNKQKELDELYRNMEQNSEFTFILGLKRKISEEFTLSLKKLKQAQIPLFLIGNQNFDDYIQLLSSYNILQSNEKILHLCEQEYDPLKYKIRQNIQYIIQQQKVFTINEFSEPPHYIFLNGNILPSIMQDDYLKYHLAFIIKYSSGFCGYNFQVQHKKQLVKLMNQHWKLLTIGQSIDNFKYFHYSKYSISLQDNICKPCSVPSNFYSILNLLFVDSQLIIKLLNEFGYFHFYRAYLFCIVLIFKQDCQSMPFIFLFLISFILTLIYQVLDIIPMLRQESKRNNDEVMFLSIKLYHQTPDKLVYGRIFIMAMVDSLICIMMIVLQDQLYKDIHLFVFLEATEKIRLTSILRNGQKYITSIIFLFYLIITFTLIVSQLNNNLRLLILDFINDNVFPNYVFSLSFLLFTLQIIGKSFNQVQIGIPPNQTPYTSKQYLQIKDFKKRLKRYYQENQQSLVLRTKFTKELFYEKEFIDELLSQAITGRKGLSEEEKMSKQLVFLGKQVELDYQNQTIIKEGKVMRWQIHLSFLSMEGIIFLYVLAKQLSKENQLLITGWVHLGNFGMIMFQNILAYQQRNSSSALSCILTLCYFIRVFMNLFIQYIAHAIQHCQEEQHLVIMYILFVGLTYQDQSRISYLRSLILKILIVLNEVIIILVFNRDLQNITYSILKLFQSYAILFLPLTKVMYKCEYLRRQHYIMQNKLHLQQKKVNDVLGLLMPRFIKERMTKGQISISEDQGEVSILFCDICDFDSIIQKENESIIQFLDGLFRAFDQICASNDVQKIETVGKTYMAAAGLKDYDIVMDQKHQKNSTQRVLQSAIEMIDSSRQFKSGGKELILKIGIHYGRVMAGVIGGHKPQFSLIGDTVNTTSRVCSTGEQGMITLSEQAYKRISSLNYQFNMKEVQAKGKGVIKTYQLNMMNRSVVLKSELSQKNSQKQIAENNTSKQARNVVRENSKIKNIDRKQKLFKKVSFDPDKLQQIQNQMNQDKQEQQQQQQSQSQRAINLEIKRALESKKDFEQNNNQGNGQIFIQPIHDEGDLNNNNDSHSQKIRDPSMSIKKSQIREEQSPKIIKKRADLRRKTKVINKKTQILQQNEQDGKNYGQFDSQKSECLGNYNLIVQQQQQFLNLGVISGQSPQFLNRGKKQISQKNSFNLNNQQIEEKGEEIEIPKLQRISEQQDKIDISFVKQLIQYKVDTQDSTNQTQEQFYIVENHSAYYDLYEVYKDYEYKEVKLSFSILSVILLYDWLIEFSIDLIISVIIIKLFVLLFTIAISIYFGKISQHDDIRIPKIILFIYYISISSLYVIISYYQQNIYASITLLAIAINIYFLQLFNRDLQLRLIMLQIVSVIIIIGITHQWVENLSLIVSVIPLIKFISILIENYLAKNYEIHLEQEKLKEKQNTFIQHLLPSHVLFTYFSILQILQRFLSDMTNDYSDVFEDCTILFADIAGFTKYSSSVQPEQVVNMLRSLFTQFDQCCIDLSLYKLYTIGDCYVIIGISDANSRNVEEEALNVVEMGFQMIEIINQVKQNVEFAHLNMRIGVHTGKVIGGVVGTDVVRYDIYGEDVTVANKMESNGIVNILINKFILQQEGSIQVSDITKALLENAYGDFFKFTWNKDVIFGDEVVKGYILELNNQSQKEI